MMWLFLTWASDSCVPTTFCCCCCSPTADFGLFFQCWVAYNLRLLRVAKLAFWNRQFGRPIVICLILDFVKIWRKIQKEDRVGLKRVVVIMPNFLFVAPRWWRQGQFWNKLCNNFYFRENTMYTFVNMFLFWGIVYRSSSRAKLA